MRKDRVWMKFKKEDFNQLMGVLSKQMERYSEIEAQNLNLKADIKDEKEAVEIVLNDSEETLIYHKSPEEEYFTREALKHETINFDKESEIEEDLDELEK
ncbi:MAG: hypothetical protein ACLTFV_24465 [[Clostridium] innocuum]